jgi:type I restriction enzyme S subunit
MWPSYPLRRVAPPEPSKLRFAPDEHVWHLGLEHIESQTSRILHMRLAPAADAGTSTLVFDEAQVLYSKLRPYLNKVVRPRQPGIATSELVPLRPNPRILYPDYLAYFLRSPQFVAFASRRVAGVKMPRVMMDRFWAYPTPVPTLSEQRRIIEILDQAEAIRDLRWRANHSANDIIPALFVRTFGDPFRPTEASPRKPVGELATVTTGNTPPRKKKQNYGDHIEWVKSDNLNTPSHFITPTAEHLSAIGVKVGRTAPPGSTLVTCIAGSPGAIGNAALADREVAFNQQINAATPKEGVDPYFLYAHFLVGKRLVQNASTGGMKGLVSKSRFSAIEFLSPPPELQARFGRQCKVLCDQNELRLRQAEQLDTLFSVLLHRAFSGELTARWREAHMEELVQEMEEQARALGLDNSEVHS